VGVSGNAPFTGMSTGTLDKKARVCIPATWRHILAAQSTNGVYVRIALLTPSLECFGARVMQRFHDAQTEMDPFFTAAHDTEAFALLSLSQELSVDETGRVRLPDDFIAHAALTDNVTFVGMGSKFEIWDSSRYASIYRERMAAAQDLLRAKQQQARKP
jgi:MraZ protein